MTEQTTIETPMIPVYTGIEGHKPRLPRGFSWAVGTQRLSERFAGIPQIGDIAIWYYARPDAPRTRLEQIVRQAIPYQVFSVWYSTNGTPHWSLMVYPVASEKRSLVLRLLESSAFPRVKEWLCERKTEVWLSSDKHLRCIYHQADGRIELKAGNR